MKTLTSPTIFGIDRPILGLHFDILPKYFLPRSGRRSRAAVSAASYAHRGFFPRHHFFAWRAKMVSHYCYREAAGPQGRLAEGQYRAFGPIKGRSPAACARGKGAEGLKCPGILGPRGRRPAG